MRVVSLRAELAPIRAELGQVGFVPTMGSLHEGHMSLVRRAAAECEHVVASIFVNPTQFGDPDDLAAYPRQLGKDLVQLEAAGCDLAFVPFERTIYPHGYRTRISVGDVTTRLEGEHRPGHFDGVATVVATLFSLVQPQVAYFGRKDAQQCVVIRAMVADLGLPVDIRLGDTLREDDGLAMSSRNARLTPEQRAAAPVVHRALHEAATWWREAEQTPSGDDVRRRALNVLAGEPLAAPEYVSLAHPDTLMELDEVPEGVEPLLSTAVRFGEIRLIDNLSLPAR